MSDWRLSHELIKSGLSLVSASTVLGLGWFVGNHLNYRWSIRQKLRESQLSVLQQFYLAYGEFFAVWKLWNRLESTDLHHEERQWELHKRAAAAEAIVEGILVKLSSEVVLSNDELRDLACFRQAVQQLRQSIRRNVILPWPASECPEYIAFKVLAVRASILLGSEWSSQRVPVALASGQLLCMTSNRFEESWVQLSETMALRSTASSRVAAIISNLPS